MADLTHGSIGRHLASMAGFIGAGLVFQAAYFLVDLYFVSRLGPNAIAGVSAAGNFNFLAIAATQIIGVGGLSLISRAIGRRDNDYANLAYNQLFGMSMIAALATLVVGYWLAGPIMARLAADPGSAVYGTQFLYGALPSMAMMFPLTALGSGLRASGVVQPPMLLQTGAVALNALLAPVLIAGWLTGIKLGALGAGLASSIASLVALLALLIFLPKWQNRLHSVLAEMRPRAAVWWDIIKIGVPAAGEFFLMFMITGIVYWCIRRFGPQAQAGFGVGGRVMQAFFLPSLAISFAAAPIAGQNFGAKQFERVRQTFKISLAMGVSYMLVLMVVCQINSAILAGPFTNDPEVLAVAAQYLRLLSFNFVASAFIFAASGMFQALGDTRPSFYASASRIFTYVVPMLWLETQPWAKLVYFWWFSVGSAALQAVISMVLLQGVFRRKLQISEPAEKAVVA